MAERRKKEKITYIDDGSTIADMSSVKPSGFSSGQHSAPKIRLGFWDDLKAQFRTFFDTMKLMVLPMFVVMGFILAVFLIAWLIL